MSTHGGAGYVDGSYWKGDKIVCGACGVEISDPYPNGGQLVDVPPQPKGFFKSLLWMLRGFKTYRKPVWNHVAGTPPEALVKLRTTLVED